MNKVYLICGLGEIIFSVLLLVEITVKNYTNAETWFYSVISVLGLTWGILTIYDGRDKK